jgi:hypothetical protein
MQTEQAALGEQEGFPFRAGFSLTSRNPFARIPVQFIENLRLFENPRPLPACRKMLYEKEIWNES